MPIDLKALGPPKSYPPRAQGIRAWIIVWLVCIVVVDAAIFLCWPRNRPAHGLGFWLLIAGLPNVLFLVIVILSRAQYEGAYLHAMFYNDHREARRRNLIERGQQSMRVLQCSYQLPLADKALAATIVEGAPIIKSQPLRDGTATARHTRLPDDSDATSSDPLLTQMLQQVPLDRTGRVCAQLLVPLIKAIRLLLQVGMVPAVRLVVANPTNSDGALKQLRTVIRTLNLTLPDCKAIAAADGLMPVDAWLDARETRPLLVIAVQLHETPPEDSAEAGVALILLSHAVSSPNALKPLAALHRPVAVSPPELAEGLAIAMLWGRTTSSAVNQGWMTGFESQEQSQVTQACRRADLSQLTKFEARRLPDSVLGHAGLAAGWLAVAAAIEHAADAPQLILNRTPSNCQAAILQAYSQTS